MIWLCFCSISLCFMDALTEAGGINELVVVPSEVEFVVVLSTISFGWLITNCITGAALSTVDSFPLITFELIVGVNKSITTLELSVVRCSWPYVDAVCSSLFTLFASLRSIFFIAAAFNLHIPLAITHNSNQAPVILAILLRKCFLLLLLWDVNAVAVMSPSTYCCCPRK